MTTYTLNVKMSVMTSGKMEEAEVVEIAQRQLSKMMDGSDFMGVSVDAAEKEYDPNECPECGSEMDSVFNCCSSKDCDYFA